MVTEKPPRTRFEDSANLTHDSGLIRVGNRDGTNQAIKGCCTERHELRLGLHHSQFVTSTLNECIGIHIQSDSKTSMFDELPQFLALAAADIDHAGPRSELSMRARQRVRLPIE